MSPLPVALSLTVCEKVIVEERTRNITLVSTFTKLVVDHFPTPPQRFSAFAVLTDVSGRGTIGLAVTSLETNVEIYSRRLSVNFQDRLAEVPILFRVLECAFPKPGRYQVSLSLDGEWLAHRSLVLAEKEA
jgi:hypothetical protein